MIDGCNFFYQLVKDEYQGRRNGFQSGKGHGTLKSSVGHHGWLTRKNFRILDALEWLKQ